MAIPILGAAAMAAARVVASKLATRAVGGITGSGAKSVGSVYRNSPVSRRMGDPKGVKTNQSGSVKVIPDLKEGAQALGLTKKQWQSTVNKEITDMTKRNKSGQSAKEVAAWRAVQNKSIPKKPTVKINNNTRAR